MTKLFIAVLMITLSFTASQAKTNTTEIEALKCEKFFLKYQAFESHDNTGTDIDTVSHNGDFIEFADNGKAYIFFNGKYDSIEYRFIDKNTISFGDTPFVIKNLGNGTFSLFQNEEEKNGNYNRVTYMLKKEHNTHLSFLD